MYNLSPKQNLRGGAVVFFYDERKEVRTGIVIEMQIMERDVNSIVD